MNEMTTLTRQKSDIVPLTDENVAICRRFCGTCPTHDECGADEFLFCAAGRSESGGSVRPKGCNCPVCEVWNKYGLAEQYFCINGEA